MIDEPLTPHERELIEQVRKVNKLLSLYVLAIQERKPLIADENSRLAQALSLSFNLWGWARSTLLILFGVSP